MCSYLRNLNDVPKVVVSLKKGDPNRDPSVYSWGPRKGVSIGQDDASNMYYVTSQWMVRESVGSLAFLNLRPFIELGLNHYSRNKRNLRRDPYYDRDPAIGRMILARVPDGRVPDG